jgi:hypothetical protein
LSKLPSTIGAICSQVRVAGAAEHEHEHFEDLDKDGDVASSACRI